MLKDKGDVLYIFIQDIEYPCLIHNNNNEEVETDCLFLLLEGVKGQGKKKD